MRPLSSSMICRQWLKASGISCQNHVGADVQKKSSSIKRFFHGMDIKPVPFRVGLRSVLIAAGFTLLVAILIPGMRNDVGSLSTVFVGGFMGIIINEAGFSVVTHPKQSITVIAVLSFVMMTVAAIGSAIISVSTS